MAYGLTQSPLLVAASSQYFSAADSASLSAPSTALTIEGWIKFTTIPTSNEFGLVSKWVSGSDATSSYLLDLIFGAGPTIMIRGLISSGVGATSGQVTWTGSPTTGVWYHVAMTWTGVSMKFFVNGSQMGATQTVTSLVIADTATNVKVGAQFQGPSEFFNGRMSLWRVWSSDQSANIATNMCLVLGSTTNLQAEWTLNNVLTDNSGNSNTLTNNNTITFAADVPAVCGVAAVPTFTLLGVGV